MSELTPELDPTAVVITWDYVVLKYKKVKFYLTTWLLMAFDLGIWPLPAWTYWGSHIVFINQFWFQLDFNFIMKPLSHFQSYLATWSQMIFDFDMWPLTLSKSEGFHAASVTIWPKFGSNWASTFQMKPNCTFSAYYKLKVDLRWHLTLLWPLTSSTSVGSHVASMTKVWLKSIDASEN